MQSNNLICYICKKIIENIEEASYIGKDITTGKEKYRHRKCSPKGLKTKSREQWYRNPKTQIKESDKIYDRNKEKRKLKKNLESE